MHDLGLSKCPQERVKEFIQLFTGEDAKVIGVPTELIHFIGDQSKAVLLAQLIYWMDKGHRKDGLIYKTYKEIFQETGIKDKTCNRYYKEFREMGFFDWQVKKANKNPTIHYKLDMDKLCELIQTFWENQNGQNDGNEIDKMSESLTENTAKNTTNISLYKKEILVGNEIQNKDQMLGIGNDQYQNTKILIPQNFAPTWDAMYRGMLSFPNTSAAWVTEKFIEYYKARGDKKTIYQWHQKWWDWMQSERDAVGNEKLVEEQNAILRYVAKKVFDCFYDMDDYLVDIGSLQNFLNDEYSKETLTDVLTRMYEVDWIGKIGNTFFNNLKRKEWWEKIEAEIVERGLMDEIIDIYLY